ncbi:unnamed protein product [Caenorhabditis nigoni]
MGLIDLKPTIYNWKTKLGPEIALGPIEKYYFASPSAENLGTNNTEIEIQIDSEKYGFCITSVEMCNFINIENVNLKKLGGGICEPGIQPSSGKLCNASYEVFMETEIQDGCTQIFGKLVINPKNVQNVQKLSSVEIIFGVLYIEETNLTTIDFLGNLKYISALGYNYPAITVQNNPFLSNFSFPNLKRNLDIFVADKLLCDRAYGLTLAKLYSHSMHQGNASRRAKLSTEACVSPHQEVHSTETALQDQRQGGHQPPTSFASASLASLITDQLSS